MCGGTKMTFVLKLKTKLVVLTGDYNEKILDNYPYYDIIDHPMCSEKANLR